MKKVLIYMKKSRLAPVGGPRGYLYNLANQLEKENITYIEFLPEDKTCNSWFEKIKTSILKKSVQSLSRLIEQFKGIYGKKKRSPYNLNDYDIIHFHDTWSMYLAKDSLDDYKGVVMLTSHSPSLLSKEWYNEAKPLKQKLFGKMLRDLKRIDEYSFNRADKIMFPCEEAEEPYINSYPDFIKIKDNNGSKFIYNPTGIIPKTAKLSRTEIRKQLGIPEDAIVFNYAGRHTAIKGYDDLKRIASKILSKYNNVYFLIEGAEAPLKKLDHPRWIEIGWTQDPHSYIKASDAFILPNKETYFDLILLEVISLGVIVIASETGGNKYFKNKEKEGICLYSDEAHALTIIEHIISMSKKERECLSLKTKEIFNSQFTIEIFTKRYLEIIESL